MLIYCIVYGSKRFFTVFIRGDHNRGYRGPLSQSQCICIVVVLSCMLLFF
ncbi:MAG: prolipoprotein diacylglyceryl transferase family protein [Bacteroidota bacterium]